VRVRKWDGRALMQLLQQVRAALFLPPMAGRVAGLTPSPSAGRGVQSDVAPAVNPHAHDKHDRNHNAFWRIPARHVPAMGSPTHDHSSVAAAHCAHAMAEASATRDPGRRTMSPITGPCPAWRLQATAEASPTETLVARFAKYYTPVVVLACLCLAFIPWAAGAGNHRVRAKGVVGRVLATQPALLGRLHLSLGLPSRCAVP
jgi:hypothetical protein